MDANIERHAVVVAHGDEAVTEAIVRELEDSGWTVDETRVRAPYAVVPVDRRPVDGLVYVPGLLGGEPLVDNAAAELVELVQAYLPHLRPRDTGGAHIVAVGSRDWLGWPGRPHVAASAAGLVAGVRSLALTHGRAGVTVNAVVGLPLDAEARRDIGVVPGTHLYEPAPLTGEPVTAEDIASTVAFFLDPRSGYVTGQVLHCCGGAALLSSLSA